MDSNLAGCSKELSLAEDDIPSMLAIDNLCSEIDELLLRRKQNRLDLNKDLKKLAPLPTPLLEIVKILKAKISSATDKYGLLSDKLCSTTDKLRLTRKGNSLDLHEDLKKCPPVPKPLAVTRSQTIELKRCPPLPMPLVDIRKETKKLKKCPPLSTALADIGLQSKELKKCPPQPTPLSDIKLQSDDIKTKKKSEGVPNTKIDSKWARRLLALAAQAEKVRTLKAEMSTSTNHDLKTSSPLPTVVTDRRLQSKERNKYPPLPIRRLGSVELKELEQVLISITDVWLQSKEFIKLPVLPKSLTDRRLQRKEFKKLEILLTAIQSNELEKFSPLPTPLSKITLQSKDTTRRKKSEEIPNNKVEKGDIQKATILKAEKSTSTDKHSFSIDKLCSATDKLELTRKANNLDLNKDLEMSTSGRSTI